MTGRGLANLRDRLKLSQEKMAAQLDLSRHTLSRYEQEDRVPRWLEYAARYLASLRS